MVLSVIICCPIVGSPNTLQNKHCAMLLCACEPGIQCGFAGGSGSEHRTRGSKAVGQNCGHWKSYGVQRSAVPRMQQCFPPAQVPRKQEKLTTSPGSQGVEAHV